MRDPDRAQAIWDRVAPRYDRQIELWERIWFTGTRQWVTERAQGQVLEIAIGTGQNLPHYGPETTLTGIDLSDEMLAIARQRAAGLRRDVALRQGDATALPYDDESFDTAVCTLSLCSIPDPAAALDQMHRVLRPGGRLLLVDHIGSSWPPLYAAQWLLEQATGRLAGEYFTRRQLPAVGDRGFEIVESQRTKAGTIECVHATKPR